MGEVAHMSLLKPERGWNESRKVARRVVRRNGDLWMRHMKGQEKDSDSTKEMRGRTVAEEGVTDTRVLPEGWGWTHA